jgi:hypothetical protein
VSNISTLVFPVFAPTMAITFAISRKALGDLLAGNHVSPHPRLVFGIATRLEGLRQLMRENHDPRIRTLLRRFHLFNTMHLISFATCLGAFVYDFTRNVILHAP